MAANGALPGNIHCAADYETLAQQALDTPIFAHLSGGGGRDSAVHRNRAALDAVNITPRVLRDLTAGSTACLLAGAEIRHPIFLAPVAFQALFHPGAELETARAADATDTGMVVSTLSSIALEDVARGAAAGRWFQLYMQPSRQVTLDLVRRAEAAGYKALVLTLDAPVHAPGLTVLRSGFRGAEPTTNLEPYPPPAAPEQKPGESRVFQGFMRQAPTWTDIAWLRRNTKLPLWLKGVLHADDAHAAMEAGAAGVIVSNHGGRTLDSAPSSLSALPEIRATVGARFPLMFDGGVRSGEDIFKAIALGADAVLVGRLQACALAVAGALGVGHMIKLLREELEVCMALSGCATISDIARAQVRWTSQGDIRC